MSTHYPTRAGETSPQESLYVAGRRVGLGRFANWLAEGVTGIRRCPGLWFGLATVCMVLVLLFRYVPLLRPLAVLIAPIVTGTVMAAQDRLRSAGKVTFAEVIQPVLQHRNALLGVGLLSAAIVATGYLFMIALLHASLMASVMTSGMRHLSITYGDDTGVRGMLEAAAIVPTLSVALAAAWFAPALVMLHGLSPVNAMVASLNGAARNWPILLIHIGVIGVAGAGGGVIPLSVSFPVIGLLALLTIYPGYRDLFVRSGPTRVPSSRCH